MDSDKYKKPYVIRGYKGKCPIIPKSCTIMENVFIQGDVTLGENCVIMPGVVIRGECNPVVIGEKTNIQDMTCIHVELGAGGDVQIGKCVTVGHGAILHGCKIQDRAVIGMGAIIQDYAVIEEEAWVGAGALVTPKSVIPKGHLAVGVPAKVRREITDEERKEIDVATEEYQQYAAEYRKENGQ